MPGSQLVNRLQDLHYRVRVVNDPSHLPDAARHEMPLLLVADLARSSDVCAAIKQIKDDPATGHIPIIAYAPDIAPDLIRSADQNAGLLAVTDTGLMGHLEQLIEQALQV